MLIVKIFVATPQPDESSTARLCLTFVPNVKTWGQEKWAQEGNAWVLMLTSYMLTHHSSWQKDHTNSLTASAYDFSAQSTTWSSSYILEIISIWLQKSKCTVIPAMVQRLFFDIITQRDHKYATPSPLPVTTVLFTINMQDLGQAKSSFYHKCVTPRSCKVIYHKCATPMCELLS